MMNENDLLFLNRAMLSKYYIQRLQHMFNYQSFDEALGAFEHYFASSIEVKRNFYGFININGVFKMPFDRLVPLLDGSRETIKQVNTDMAKMIKKRSQMINIEIILKDEFEYYMQGLVKVATDTIKELNLEEERHRLTNLLLKINPDNPLREASQIDTLIDIIKTIK